MNNHLYIPLLLLFFYFGNVTAATQDSLIVKMDSIKIIQRSFEEPLAEKYTGDVYDYDTMEGEAENLITKYLTKFFRTIAEWFGVDINPSTLVFLNYMMYLLLILFGIYIVVKLLVGNQASSFLTNKSTTLAALQYEEEHIENVDLDAYIKDALKTGDYRLAIRFMYLRTLKQLSAANKIAWDFEKTNRDYYNELEEESLKEHFRKISYLYDYVWYGEFSIDEERFITAEQDFTNIEKQLSNVR